jgi:hypothetical protein
MVLIRSLTVARSNRTTTTVVPYTTVQLVSPTGVLYTPQGNQEGSGYLSTTLDAAQGCFLASTDISKALHLILLENQYDQLYLYVLK